MPVKKIRDTITPNIRQIQQRLEQLPRAAYDEWVKVTPKQTGNARRNTRLRGDTIDANYAYAQRLNEGWSKQAPDGMQEPVEKFIENYVRKLGR